MLQIELPCKYSRTFYHSELHMQCARLSVSWAKLFEMAMHHSQHGLMAPQVIRFWHSFTVYNSSFSSSLTSACSQLLTMVHCENDETGNVT